MSAPALFLREGGSKFRAAGVDTKGRPQGAVLMGCGRCGGAGKSDKWAHTGYTCYDCGGAGTKAERLFPLYTADELAKLNAKRDALRDKKAAKAAAARAVVQAQEDAAKAARLGLLDLDPLANTLRQLLAASPENEFLASVWARYQVADLSQGQVEAVERFAAKAKARAAAVASSAWIGQPGERVTFAGKVESVRCLRSPTSWEAGRYLVKLRTDTGAALTWFSGRDAVEGELVEGTAMVKSQDEFRGEKQTVIKNPRFKKEKAAA